MMRPALALGPARRGMALLLVIAVVALATVLGLAMLSGATLQSQTGANARHGAAADSLVESGVNLALYYLQYPEKAPALNAAGYWEGTGGGISLNPDVPGTVQVSIVRDPDDSWTYEIRSTATITGGPTTITKKGGCRVYVRNQFMARSPGAFNGGITLNNGTSFDGDVYCSKTMAMKTGSIVTGVGYCKTAQTGIGYTQPATSPHYSKTLTGGNVAPLPSELFMYYPTYAYNGQQYNTSVVITGALLPANTLTSALGVLTRGIIGGNPMGVYYCDSNSGGALKLGDNCSIDGTLIVNGDCQVAGTNVRITANSGFPALVVTGNLELVGPGSSATLNGVVYVGGQLKTSGSSSPLCKLTINGALLSGNNGTSGSSPIASSYNAVTVVNYDVSKCIASDLSWQLRSPTGVSIVRWGLP
jgi:hypothetical protein